MKKETDLPEEKKQAISQRYTVTREGLITNLATNKTLKFHKNKKGYPCVSLHLETGDQFFRVHRLVALFHVANPDNKPFVNHKDRDRSNYHADNLEWVTPKENVAHSIQNGGRAGWKNRVLKVDPEKNGNNKSSHLEVKAIRDLHSLGYSQDNLATIFKLSQQNISKIVNNLIWKVAS